MRQDKWAGIETRSCNQSAARGGVYAICQSLGIVRNARIAGEEMATENIKNLRQNIDSLAHPQNPLYRWDAAEYSEACKTLTGQPG